MKLGNKILFMFLGVIAALMVPLSIMTLLTTENHFRSYVFEGDVRKAEAFAPLVEGYYEKQHSWKGLEDFLNQPPFAYHEKGTQSQEWIQERVVVLDQNRTVIVDTKHLLVGTIHPQRHLHHAIMLSYQSEPIGTLLVGTMVEPNLTPFHEEYLNAVRLTLVISFILAAFLAVSLSLFFSKSIARPILQLSDFSKRIGHGEKGLLVPVTHKDELTELQTSFNAMSKALKTSEDQRQRLLADSAHELRTPVSLIQGTLEAVMDGIFPVNIETLKPVYEATLRLSRLVQSLTDLEALSLMQLNLNETDMKEFLEVQAGLFKAQMQKKKIHFFVDLKADQNLFLCDSQRLGQVITNLLSNALRATPESGSIRIASYNAEKTLVIEVEDSGPGIPEEEREKVFDRFYRIDPARSPHSGGQGLGLTISKEIVKAHKGNIRIETSQWGGAKFLVELPMNVL